jgi:ligand-binding sensor domain-containing protein
MVNDLLSTDKALYVAATEGLFMTLDGVTFTRMTTAVERGFNDLAFDGANLWATTPSALHRLRVAGFAGRKDRTFWRPGGSRALQAVDATKHGLWLASEDKGAILFRDDGKDVTIFDRAAGLPASWALDVAALPDGSALVATLRDGLVHLRRDGRNEVVADLPDSWLLHVSRSDETTFVGTQDGAVVLDASLRATPIRDLPDPRVHAIFRDGDALWIGTEGGVAVVR